MNTFADADGSTGSVDEPCTLLHLGDEFLVEQTLGLLVERAVDGDDIGLSKHLLEALDSSAANFLGGFSGERLVVEVEEFLAVEGYETSQDTFSDTSDTDGGDDLALDIEGVLGDGSDVPFTTRDHLVRGDKVADEGEHGQDDVLGDGDDIGPSDLGDEDLVLVGGVQVNVVGSWRLASQLGWGGNYRLRQ